MPLRICYFLHILDVPRHAWPHPIPELVYPKYFEKFVTYLEIYLLAKNQADISSFRKYSVLKNPEIWLAKNILASNENFARHEVCYKQVWMTWSFIYSHFQKNQMTKSKIKKIINTLFLVPFCTNLSKNEYRPLSVFRYSNVLNSYQKPEKKNKWAVLEKISKLTDRQW